MQHIFFTTYNYKGNMKIKVLHYTDSINYELEQTARLMKLLGLQLFDKLQLNITPDEYAALDTVSVNAGICQRDLAKLLLKDRANTGRILESLEQKGFITRFIDTKNNRLVKKMGITEKGYKELDLINSKIKGHIENARGKITPREVQKVQEVLKKFRKNLEQMVETNI